MPLFDFLKQDDGNFFQWLEDASNITLQASLALRELCYDFRNPQEAAARLHDFEHQGDDIGHDIYNKLNNTFVTPMDREDIIRLYSSIDDMTDLIHSAADMMNTYKVDFVLPTAKLLADCIVGCAEEIVKAVPHLRKRKELAQIQDFDHQNKQPGEPGRRAVEGGVRRAFRQPGERSTDHQVARYIP